MLKVVSITDTVVDYNGHTYYLGSVASEKIPEYPATFAGDLGVKEGDFLDDIQMDLTTAQVEETCKDCVRIRSASIHKTGKLSRYIDLSVLGIIIKPKKTTDECPRVGLDAKPQLRFTLKSRDAYGNFVCRLAFAKKLAPAIFELKNRTLVIADVTIMPDTKNSFALCVQAYNEKGGNL